MPLDKNTLRLLIRGKFFPFEIPLCSDGSFLARSLVSKGLLIVVREKAASTVYAITAKGKAALPQSRYLVLHPSSKEVKVVKPHTKLSVAQATCLLELLQGGKLALQSEFYTWKVVTGLARLGLLEGTPTSYGDLSVKITDQGRAMVAEVKALVSDPSDSQ